MPKMRLIVGNSWDAATLSASPALAAGFEEKYLQYQDRTLRARSTSTASQDWKAAWAVGQPVDAVALLGFNFTAAAQARMRGYTDAAFSTGLVDNAAADCFNISGLSRLDDITSPDFRHLKNHVRYVTAMSSMQSLNITTTDAGNPDGFQEIGRVFVGKYFEFTYDADFGGDAFSNRDLTTQGRQGDTTLLSSKRGKFRRWALKQSMMPKADWEELLSISRYCGQDRDLVLDAYPNDNTRTGLYSRALVKFVEPSEMVSQFYNAWDARLTLEEV